MPPLVERSQPELAHPKAKRDIVLPLPSALDMAIRGAKLCVVSMDRHGRFS